MLQVFKRATSAQFKMADAGGSGIECNVLPAWKVEFIDELNRHICDSGFTSPCVKWTSGSSVPANLFGGDDEDRNNFAAVTGTGHKYTVSLQ